MKRRNREEIIISFLEAAMEGANKTALVYKSSTNFHLTSSYIDLLLRNGLLEYSSSTYKTTEKGKQYIKLAKSLKLE